jgi:tRNA threonylcarbamoyladenosine biosynthesis protein TsaB
MAGTKALGMKDALFVPLIDARRMEVYRAIYDESGTELLSPHAEILTEASFAAYAGHSLVFAGDGAEKCKLLFPPSGQYLYPDLLLPSAQHMLQDAEDSFRQNAFEDLAYFEPYYLKDFIAGKPKVKGLQ